MNNTIWHGLSQDSAYESTETRLLRILNENQSSWVIPGAIEWKKKSVNALLASQIHTDIKTDLPPDMIQDVTPDAFSFADYYGVDLSTLVVSDPIMVAGTMSAPISVTGGEYSIDGGAYTSAPGTVTKGQTVRVRHTSSAFNSTATNTVLTIGGVSDTFTTTTVAPALDTIPPSIPTLTTMPSAYTNANSIPVEVNGEAGAAVLVNGTFDGYLIDGNGKVTIPLNTSGPDGVMLFNITLKDAAGNVSAPLSFSIEKGTVAPSSVYWANASGFVPDTQGSVNTGMVLAGNISFSGATGISVASVEGGTVSGATVNDSGQIVFNYEAPLADPDKIRYGTDSFGNAFPFTVDSVELDTIRITGTDKFGNAFTIDMRVDLPYISEQKPDVSGEILRS